ncbi:M64 family metallopeptidase [Bacteroides caecigallinarum]|uniref:M64 family metallopeptidase n=1 Tax=Bacteroides caecigallinarum TaxID=1411144 RepID=UPI001F44D931|nr:M64 family metallopeptidase [Bacteroides caecigallinarum]MCF2583230.1 redoxin domain-containing protein [Bacteroides caecigallinarum]
MKHTYIIFCLSLLLLSLAGCKQDELQSSHQSDTRLTSVKATTSAAVKSRTQLSGNAVIWEQSDAIGIFSNTTAEAVRYDLTEIQGDEARFESETGVSGEEFYAFYPYSAQSAVEGTKISYRLTDGQDYRAGSFDTGDCPMVAKSTHSDFRFLQTCGIIRLRLTGTMAVSSIRLQGNNGEALAGDGTIDIASDAPVFTIDGSGDKLTAIQLRTSANVQLSELSVTEFYFVVAPQTLTQGITVDITGTINGKEQTIRKQTQKSITVTRSVISSFAAVDTDAELEPEGPTDRDILIALYDATNGDNWTNNTNWCTNAPLSEWYGVTLDYSQERVQYIHLSYNNLVGSIPEEIGNLTELYTLDLSGNTLTGEIPSSIGNMHILGYLYLNNNQLTGSIPQEIGNLSDLRACYIYENQLMGNIPSEFGNLINLEYCYLFGNQLTGEVPETLSRLTKLQAMDFSDNMLGGDVPEAVTATDWWQINGYRCIEQNEPGGFTFETLNLYIPDFTATDNRGNTIRTIDIVSSHKVTLYYVWATWCGYSKAFHPVMSELYQRYKNHSLEIIGICTDGMDNPADANNYIESNDMEWPTLMENPEGGIPYSGFPTVIAFDETGKMIFHSSFTSRDELPEFLKGILGEGDAPYESTDFSADRKAYTLQTASEGNGINVVLMGDAFSDRQIADGTYEKVMQQAADAFFSEEPYASFRDMFNVYYVNAVSQNEGYFDGGETAFSCYFGEGTRVGGNDGLCMQYAQAAFNFTDEQMQDVLIIVMMNSTRYAGTCWMYYNTGYTSDYGRGTSVAYFPIGTTYEDLATILHHEAGGHGFAKLNDEYAYEYMGMIPANEIRDEQNMRENYGWGKNTDYIPDPARVYWSKFIADSRYASENIGVYEGACTYWTGAYRPTENSIMNDNTGGFNAPSREAIYYRIHKLAYGESWTYDYEEFVNWDLNQRARSRVSVVPQKKYPPTAPPVVIKARWENGRFVYE